MTHGPSSATSAVARAENTGLYAARYAVFENGSVTGEAHGMSLIGVIFFLACVVVFTLVHACVLYMRSATRYSTTASTNQNTHEGTYPSTKGLLKAA